MPTPSQLDPVAALEDRIEALQAIIASQERQLAAYRKECERLMGDHADRAREIDILEASLRVAELAQAEGFRSPWEIKGQTERGKAALQRLVELHHEAGGL